ncbi:hypothetical protein CCM_05060 [Cordyceps militaris CM01]|uniref:Uncharacterized protein n=1 Tax=Cordyceps militaris (strain CM01) TaxID=983644 RepID=G3JHJ6_CORMM|nr:uncharacterized protein CCM_05060 [Cordyceps militaris CM01]EGX90904.1 hypothetical protein CCM_05060 [Cordyceps militaris CM01]
MVQRNYVIAIIIIVLFAVLAGVSFGIWKMIHMVRQGWSATSGTGSSSSSSSSREIVD